MIVFIYKWLKNAVFGMQAFDHALRIPMIFAGPVRHQAFKNRSFEPF